MHSTDASLNQFESAGFFCLSRCLYENRPDGYPCDDGIFYTLNDSCQAGLCEGIPDYCLGCANSENLMYRALPFSFPFLSAPLGGEKEERGKE